MLVLSCCVEIDELYTKKKELVAQNKKQLDVYYEGLRAQKKTRREEETKRKEEDRRVAHETYQKEMYGIVWCQDYLIVLFVS